MVSFRCTRLLAVALLGLTAGTGRAAEFNMAVTSDGLRMGDYVSGPKLTADSLKGRVVLVEFWGIH